MEEDSHFDDPVLGRGGSLASVHELTDVRRASAVVRIVDAKV